MFRTSYFLIRKRKFISFNNGLTASDFPLQPHPYMPMVYKANHIIPAGDEKCKYMHPERGYVAYGLKTNSIGFLNGEKGDREIINPKPQGLVRINCLGESPVAGYLRYQNKYYSLPVEVERYLQHRMTHSPIEVNNFAQGAWSSCDLMINFLLRVYETNPDVLIIYAGFNDLSISLKPNFMPDYSHAKQNFEAKYRALEFMDKLPKLPLAIYNFVLSEITKKFINNIDVSLTTNIGQANYDASFQNLVVYKRNIEHIIKVCLMSQIEVVLVSSLYFISHFNKKLKIANKMQEGMQLINGHLTNLSRQYNVLYVDLHGQVPLDKEYFYDSVHFSHSGAELVGRVIGKCIEPLIKRIALSKSEIK
ncbi:MAG: hypothetical protein HQM16_16215 [Deltaproteobacteria bacterium]|nr:hypothetical protein [Deltaproteobacteria bacterium]